MKFCMPMNEAKLFISNGPFEVLGFGIGDGAASALLMNTASGMLYHVQYLLTVLGESACFLKVVGEQAL